MCTTLYVRTPLHGACVGIMFHTWVKNVFRIVDFFMKGFKRVPLPLYISVAILAQVISVFLAFARLIGLQYLFARFKGQ